MLRAHGWPKTPSASPHTFISADQLLDYAGDLDVAELLEGGHLLRGDGVLPHGRVHGGAEDQGAQEVPGPHHTGLSKAHKQSQDMAPRRTGNRLSRARAGGDLPGLFS